MRPRNSGWRPGSTTRIDAAGGKVIFAGDPSHHVDAWPSNLAADLAARSIRLPDPREAVRFAIVSFLAHPVQTIDTADGKHLEDIFCQARSDGDRTYLVALNTSTEWGLKDAVLRIRAAGTVSEWDARTGERFKVPTRSVDGWLEIPADFAPSGERVFVIAPERENLPERPAFEIGCRESLPGPYEYRLRDFRSTRAPSPTASPSTGVLRLARDPSSACRSSKPPASRSALRAKLHR